MSYCSIIEYRGGAGMNEGYMRINQQRWNELVGVHEKSAFYDHEFPLCGWQYFSEMETGEDGWSRFREPFPGRGDDRANIFLGPAITQSAGLEVDYPLTCAQQPGVRIPFTGGDTEIGLGIGQHCLGTPQCLEGFGAVNQPANRRLEPFVALQARIIRPVALEQIEIALLFGLRGFFRQRSTGC